MILNPEIYFLGKLCSRRHEYLDTGKSKRYTKKVSCCVRCEKEKKRDHYRSCPTARKYVSERKKKWRKNNRAKNQLCNKEYYKKNAKEILLRRKNDYKNGGWLKDGALKKKQRERLSDGYIKKLLRSGGMTKNIKKEDITPQMIELKRELITFNRLQKELTDGINSKRNKRTEANGKAA